MTSDFSVQNKSIIYHQALDFFSSNSLIPPVVRPLGTPNGLRNAISNSKSYLKSLPLETTITFNPHATMSEQEQPEAIAIPRQSRLPGLFTSNLPKASTQEASSTASPARGTAMLNSIFTKVRVPEFRFKWQFWAEKGQSSGPKTEGAEEYASRPKPLGDVIVSVNTVTFGLHSLPTRGEGLVGPDDWWCCLVNMSGLVERWVYEGGCIICNSNEFIFSGIRQIHPCIGVHQGLVVILLHCREHLSTPQFEWCHTVYLSPFILISGA